MIIWNKTTNRVFCLSPHQALDVLDTLRESSAWKNNCFYLSWDSYLMPFSEEKRNASRTTKNRLNSSGESDHSIKGYGTCSRTDAETVHVFRKRKDQIHTLAEEHTREVKKALGRTYAFLIELGRERLKRNQDST